jgi:fermentation-respiration switch protein FrsA (DUF1100 family)
VRSRFGLAVAVAVALAAAGCSDPASAPEPIGDQAVAASTTIAGVEAEEVAAGDDLYAAPDPIPAGDHGDLVRYQPIDHDVDGVDAYRIMYLSESLQGDPIVVTGTALVPQGAAPDGGWPVIAHSHGTTGLADTCAPSRNYPERAGELTLLAAAADRYVIAATDYEGLGTPGLHPYLVGESEGRSTMDAVRAVAQLPGVETSATTFIAGYSQGGHGALWANQVAGEWTPELEVLGTFAGAPPGELAVIGSVAAGGGIAGGFFMLMAAGIAEAFPEAHLDDILTPEGVDALAVADRECVREALTVLAGGGYVDVDPTTVEPWGELLEASSPGDVLGAGPVLIVHSEVDEVVPIGLSAAILDRQCAIGQVVERRTVPEGTHGGAAPGAYRQGVEWFDELLAGAEPASSCPPP